MPITVAPSSRSFCFSFTIAWLVVIVTLFVFGTSQRYDDSFANLSLDATTPKPPCRREYFSADQCHFVHDHCSRIDTLGLIPYLQWYYCSSHAARVPLLIALLAWLVIVFASMATAADKFLAVNLASLVHSLKISENLAGVTIFAFGNGSSDLFSTLAAMNGGNGSLAIAELFGAAAFITTMVLGAIAIIQPFDVDPKSFLGDVVCFLLAASVNLVLISDGELEWWESLVIIGMYASFVAFVLIRDRNKSVDTNSEITQQDNHVEDTENLLSEAGETTALMHKPGEVTTYEAHSDELKSSQASAKTIVVVERVTEHDDNGGPGGSDHSDVNSVVSDWASEYEHMGEIPPFIKLCEAISSFRVDSIKNLCSAFIRLPATVMVGLTTITQPEIEHALVKSCDASESSELQTAITQEPERHPKEFWLLCAQLILGPQFLAWILWANTGDFDMSTLYVICTVLACVSLTFLFVYRKGMLHPGPHLHVFLSTFGFLTATAWIYVLASEAVALIETLGVISDVSDALLGATVFAIGNSSDDIFANISVAKRGHPVLAVAACLGGPMLNTLLGIGFGSLIQVVRGNYRPYVFHVPASLFVSAASLLTGLSVVLGYVLLRGGRLDRFLGYILMSLWVTFTAVNVYVSTRG